MLDPLYTWVAGLELPAAARSFLNLVLQISNAILILIIGLLASYFLRKVLQWFFKQQQKKFPERNYGTLTSVINSLIKYAAYFFILSGILTSFGIPTESILAVAGIGSIAIGFGAQGMVADLITGATILTENQFRVGDWVEINGKSGEVEAIGLRTSRIRGINGEVHIFPNSTIQTVTNSSKLFSRARVEFPIAYTESIDHIFAILTKELKDAEPELEGILGSPEVIGITDLGPRNLTIRITVQTEIGNNWRIERELRKRIRQCFERENIAPPYPTPVWMNTEESL